MSNKILIILIGVVMVLMLGLGGGLFMMWNKLSAMETRSQSAAENAEQGDQDASVPVEKLLGPVFSLDTFIVNLADEGGKRYLRMTIDLELDSEELESEVKKRLPQVRDSILTILPTKRFDDISSAKGKTELRDQMLERINGLVVRGKVTNIYFKEFVVQ
ncbi:MAG: flagellar basal body-associated FliL family protein [Desulfobacterales bacterium]|jgi:flagellar FliL protein